VSSSGSNVSFPISLCCSSQKIKLACMGLPARVFMHEDNALQQLRIDEPVVNLPYRECLKAMNHIENKVMRS
jgi:hypothetical protein